MHGAGSLLVIILGSCFAIAFLIEIVINRRPILVALAVTPGAFASLMLLDWEAVWHEFSVSAAVYAGFAAFGAIGAVVGSGLARFIRLWLELFWDADPGDYGDRR